MTATARTVYVVRWEAPEWGVGYVRSPYPGNPITSYDRESEAQAKADYYMNQDDRIAFVYTVEPRQIEAHHAS